MSFVSIKRHVESQSQYTNRPSTCQTRQSTPTLTCCLEMTANSTGASPYNVAVRLALSSLARLNVQHFYLLKHIYDDKYVYDESVALRENSQVMDAGTGTGELLNFHP